MFLFDNFLTFLFSISIENVKQEFVIVYFWIIIFMISSLDYIGHIKMKSLDSFNLMLSSPVDPSIIFISKVVSFFIQILIVQIFLFPIFILFF